MIKSMTGFGKSTLELSGKKITIEIKSLNSKNLDVNARMPSQYREKELIFRNRIAKSLERGKVDFSLNTELIGENTSTVVNKPVVTNYIEQFRDLNLSGIGSSSSDAQLLEIAMKLPDALKTQKETIGQDEFLHIENALQEALVAINQYRLDEGEALEKDFLLRIKNLQELLKKVSAIDANRIDAVKERLTKAISDLIEKVDENRFEQELVYYIEKYDITEEKTRLDNHLNYFLETLSSPDSNGKKLGFIGQEIGREINTIGSKSNHAPMQKLVVQMKDELEKIKEQLLNVL
ncbi:YicC/YloC family endoribonuclease [Haloflavibacter putidus]|uniref:YicC family protein n=1 Tax=Haloflavibacter putidus TaxID=2576776 RepID=A0A507ZVP0_9FLAO|nr:YicC/YloC family endoribonuclease [Haloflavibacter putidus]TQD40533.1 YicC family protein [Haloflavibacter putidus]